MTIDTITLEIEFSGNETELIDTLCISLTLDTLKAKVVKINNEDCFYDLKRWRKNISR